MYYSDGEKEITRIFYGNIGKNRKSMMLLKWNNIGEVTAFFDTCFDDDNEFDMDDDRYEEYTSYLFKSIEVSGNPPIHISKHHCFLINYHNFPDEILVDGKKIN